jgi:hypothetical protein
MLPTAYDRAVRAPTFLLIVVSITVGGCGGGSSAAPKTVAAPAAPTCPELVTTLERGRVPSTPTDLRRLLRTLATTGQTLERRFQLESTPRVVEAYAAVARTRAAAATALRDGRATSARQLFTKARTIAIRAEALAADLAAACP